MTPDEAFQKKLSDVILTAKGKVIRILPDNHEGAHHQRFIIECDSGRTILIAHNIERAYRANIKIEDEVEVKGSYVWNKYGGILHNTHHDDRSACDKVSGGRVVCGPKHEDGWVVFVGKKNPHRTKNLPN